MSFASASSPSPRHFFDSYMDSPEAVYDEVLLAHRQSHIAANLELGLVPLDAMGLPLEHWYNAARGI